MKILFSFFLILQIYDIILADLLKEAYDFTCKEEPQDVVIILDSSGSISKSNFQRAQSGILKIVRGLDVETSKSRIAFQQISDDSIMKFNLDTFNSSIDIEKSIREAKAIDGVTSIGKALRMTVSDVLPIMRKNVEKTVILITDGINNVYPRPEKFAHILRKNDVRIICIGIGEKVNIDDLKRISSKDSTIILKDYKQLETNLADPVPCLVPQQDLVFLIDSSDSLTNEDFHNSMAFVKQFINDSSIQIGQEYTRVAMITFSDDAKLEFDIDTYTDLEDYFRAISKVKKWGSITALGKALHLTLTSILPKKRQAIPFNIIVVTDGVNNIYPAPHLPGDKLKEKGVSIITIGIGEEVNIKQLNALSSSNSTEKLASYSELSKHVHHLQKVVTCGTQPVEEEPVTIKL